MDVERLVRSYLLHRQQDEPPVDRMLSRRVAIRPRLDGMSQVTVVVTTLEAAELTAALDAHMPERSPAGDLRTWANRRAEAFMSLVRTGLAPHQSTGADRYLVHLVVRDGHGEVLGGEPLDDPTVAAVCCDSSVVTHTAGDAGEPLRLGRRSRGWSTAQRRAISVRDGGHCTWAGCYNTWVEVHHRIPWDMGGPTDVDNGELLCPRHHTLTHRGVQRPERLRAA